MKGDSVESFGCLYCDGYRSPCTCTGDCGARAGEFPQTCHTCPEAGPVFRNWLRSTGLYPDLGPAEEEAE